MLLTFLLHFTLHDYRLNKQCTQTVQKRKNKNTRLKSDYVTVFLIYGLVSTRMLTSKRIPAT